MSSKNLIVYDNQGLVVAFKDAGVPSQKDKTGDLPIDEIVGKHISKTVHLASRLDRPVSGLLLMTAQASATAKHVKVPKVTKKYIAITSKTDMQERTLTHYLLRDGANLKARISEERKEGYVRSVLIYKVVKSLDNYDIVEIQPLTGRFHQIRVQLAAVGRHIKGDVKYGARRANKDRSIDLHAYYLNIGDKEILAPSRREGSLWEEVDKWILEQDTDA